MITSGVSPRDFCKLQRIGVRFNRAVIKRWKVYMKNQFLSAVFACGLLSSGAYGATIGTGVVNLSGSVSVSATTVDFFGNTASGCSTPGVGAAGCFAVNVPLTGPFDPALGGLTPLTIGGTIKDLVSPPTAISGNTFLSQFVAFNNGVFFDLTRIVPGGAPTCNIALANNANYSCTPVGPGGVTSPFTLTNSADGSNASVFFNVQVDAYTGSPSTGTTPYVGAFSTQSAGRNVASILMEIGSGGAVTAAYSANFRGDNPIPEPGTVALIAIGLVAIGVSRFRRSSVGTE